MAFIEIKEKILYMDVLCVERYLDYTLAGIGSNLFVYSDKGLSLSEPIFEGERIHGIIVWNDLILLKGGRQLCLITLNKSSDGFECQKISKIQTNDWIQDVIVLENQLGGLLTAHNLFEYWSLETGKLLNFSSCEEKCILYSCKIIGDTVETLVLLAGTVFGDVLIWTPSFEENPILKSFKAHNGAVFSIEAKPKIKLLTTTSDDRSLRIWSVVSQQAVLSDVDWRNSNIQLIHTLFGHMARVWRSLILPDNFLTIGEDSQLMVWSSDYKMIKSVCLHQGSGIRALHYSAETDTIITGGEDGGINAISLKHLINRNVPLKVLSLGRNVSTKVCFIEKGFVYTMNGCCILITDAGEEVVYKNDNFASYCLLEVFGDEIIMMGSIKGLLVVINSKTKAIIEEQVMYGRIYSIHCLKQFLVICGPEGRINLYKFLSGRLNKVGTMTLPNCRERWTTCGVLQNDRIILGDRMGNLHVYELHGGENPMKSFRKIHSYLGVTDLTDVDGACISIGRDGTVKEFTKDLIHSVTCKLPMEWPWKIVRYKDDLLILGFHGVSFVVWSKKGREIIASHDCGGGHRSCDYKLEENKLRFLYVKEKKVFVVYLTLDGITRIRDGFHGKEINCLKILQSEPLVIVTGSEDTTFRLSIVEELELRQVEVIKKHVSSIRAVCACPSETNLIVVSVGGKGQLVVWGFDLTSLKCQELASHYLRKETRNWKSTTLIVDPETRIMCADILKQDDEFVIATGCSDCQIRIFSYSGVLNHLRTISYTHCVLKIVILKVGPIRLLASMATDGNVVFWEMTDCSKIKQMKRFSLHQSGINSFQFEEIEFGRFILVTGGDDNLISVAFVEITGSEINLTQVWESRTTHSCQITGIAILKKFLITTSIDQRITIWKWSWQEGKFKMEMLKQQMTAVPDVQGLDAVWLNNSKILVAVHGKGMEVLQIQIISPESEKVDN